MKKRILLIDDQRDLTADVVARTYSAGIEALKNQGPFDELLLDHDLGYPCAEGAKVDRAEDGREMTGYDVICWLEQNPEYMPWSIVLVTQNPSGRERMRAALRKLYRVGNLGLVFTVPRELPGSSED